MQNGYYPSSNTMGLGDLFSTQSLFWATLLIVGFLILFGLLLSKGTSPNLSQRAAQQKQALKPLVPVVQPKSAAPNIVKLEDKPAPVMEPKALVLPVVAPATVETAVVVEDGATEADSVPKRSAIDDTFEAYRQAMLASGPRQMEEEARAEMQSKNGLGNSATWREQTAVLRNSLKDETAAAFLERNNVSINDRMVAIFDAVKA